ncbi:replication factor A protein 3 [Hygrophoropsis aurantiaca]|uniref:Replication factor A protein 3 n=1 Tax=Hygrophoropsis aurantiaca TaxID=72124 RepID=A0ACB8AA42_9AGAM|nr:replication factor A protein 3 [Hygrophoropsis aurantiaca]
MGDHISTRVNSAKLAQFVGQTVRLPCKVLRFQAETAMVESTDGGQVEVRLPKEHTIASTFVEVIGTVIDISSIKLLGCINLDENLDMKFVNDVIEVTFDPRFRKTMF